MVFEIFHFLRVKSSGGSNEKVFRLLGALNSAQKWIFRILILFFSDFSRFFEIFEIFYVFRWVPHTPHPLSNARTAKKKIGWRKKTFFFLPPKHV